jgi:glycosyltransferase involved in cell wall biosynthesis
VHIARIRHLFYPDMPRDYFFELSMRQANAGNEVDVLTWNKGNHPLEETVSNGFTIFRLAGLNFSLDGIITDYPYLPNLPEKMKKLKPEIVHGESHLFLTTIQAIRIATRLGIPSVVTVHGVIAKRSIAVDFVQNVYLRTLGLWLFENTDRIICLTKSDAQEIIGFGCSSEKIELIPNAVDTNRFRPRKVRQKNLVVWVGRFVPEKGLDCLIKAAKIVVKEYKNVEFALIGYGPLKEKTMKCAHDYGLSNNVHFMGPFSRDEIADFLGKASVFVLPSLKEGLPLSLLEAMASGLATVGSHVQGISDVVTHEQNGILVPPENPEALASSILTLLNDENLRRRLGQSARRLIEEKHNWNIITSKIERVYNEVTRRVNPL